MVYTESDLDEFYRFLTRRSPFTSMGGSLTTYPNGDENQRAIYERCAELERRGLAQRRALSSDVIIFSELEQEA